MTVRSANGWQTEIWFALVWRGATQAPIKAPIKAPTKAPTKAPSKAPVKFSRTSHHLAVPRIRRRQPSANQIVATQTMSGVD